ncbi:hypothetical protein PRZ48_013625 [Zasmidium cellare]|uniref:Photolyase/cryptochrome alpha/beta domain-containing protein n=1 Tax=Zasmidium cellare TaxID=395010 RepID=A0ABR0E1Z4_ZASCE|nr:hypothetical protein PRZ48_013625 [Zasmidium cellare]
MPPKKHSRAPSGDAALSHPTPKRAKEIDADPPYAQLTSLLESTTPSKAPTNVLHWFRSKDLRMQDNKGLHAASQKAKEGKGSLLGLYVYSPKDLEWHGTSPARIDFLLESLRLLKEDLEEKNIPLAIVTAAERKNVVPSVLDFVKKWDVSHVYADMEYEVDELRRDIKVAEHAKEKGWGFEVLHDQTVVQPGTLTTGAGGPHKVFTPYHKDWLVETKENPGLLELSPEPEGNDEKAKKEFKELFGGDLPALPEGKSFASDEERSRLRKLWPAGHTAGLERCSDFLKNKVSSYATHRSEPAKDNSSRLSPYFASGVISVREALPLAKKHNANKHFNEGDKGIDSWVREIVFREFYRHTLIGLPHDSMNLPHNLKFDFVEWEDDEEGWKKWCEGKTGVPFVDAGMRQLNHEAWMHNRCRMNVSSYLSGNLLIDYRRGERYFAEHLIDFDLANNHNGWEPSYTIFNPVVQAEKCDKDGEFIRKWVPELKGLKGKEVFDPFHRLGKAEFEKLGYPRPHVDFRESSLRAKERYKRDLAEADI